jgi:MYXO-CTERM domain-containing protein
MPREFMMRNETIKKCAAGAMLFGGTLGATSAAEAGLVVWNCNIAVSASVNGAYSYGPIVNVETQQFFFDTDDGPVGTPFFDWDLNFSSVSGSRMKLINNDQAFGFVGNATGSGTAKLAANTVVESTLASPFQYSQTGSLMVNVGNDGRWFEGDIGYFGFRFNVASGAVRYGWGEIDLNAGSLKEGVVTTLVYDDTGASVTVGVVPAPGALAVLGVAGIVGSRRRR